MKYTVPRDCHRRSYVLSPSGRTQSGAGHQQCSQRPTPEKASRGSQTQQPVSEHDERPSKLCAQRPSLWQWWTPSSKTDPDCQRRLRHTSEGNSLETASRRRDTRPTSPGTHFQQFLCTCRKAIASPRPEQHTTLRDQQHSGAQELPKNSSVTTSIYTVLAQYSHTHTLRNVSRCQVRPKTGVYKNEDEIRKFSD